MASLLEMLTLENILSHFLTILSWIYFIVFVALFLVSCANQKINIRKKYINGILKIFEFGNKKIIQKEKKKKLCHSPSIEDESETSSEFLQPDLASQSLYSLNAIKDIQGYQLQDTFPLITAGIGSVVEDSVIPYFVAQRLPYWNLLSRNNAKSYELVSARLTVFWIVGFFIRYGLFLPIRFCIFLLGMGVFFICSIFVGCFPNGSLKRSLNAKLTVACFDFIGGALSLVATFHNRENMPHSGIAVANHTSPIDSLILATDTCYDLVGQKHEGVIGYFMAVLGRSSSHIWFERSVAKDRARVTTRMCEHVADKSLPPILLFPEGVCVNNTSVMQFKKGVFEIDTDIYPIAIKFDPRYGDAYWWQDYFFYYILCMMTSWAIVCDVWYLPPMRKKADETAIQFANRVKAVIAEVAGLTDIPWDGFLKSNPVRQEMKERQQLGFANYLLTKNASEEENTVTDSHEVEGSIENILPTEVSEQSLIDNDSCRQRIIKVPKESEDT